MNQPNPRLHVDVDGFSGPLDMLVHLIVKHEMDITTIELSKITDAFLQTVRDMQQKDLDLAGEYLVLASTLVRYKSRALLPKEETEPEDEELADHLLELRRQEYERFRALADDLRSREEMNLVLFPRIGSPPEGPKEVIEYTEISIYDLQRTFSRILEEIGDAQTRMIEGENYSVDEKMLEIEALIEHNERVVLTAYLRTLTSKLEVIVVFLALLELIRMREIRGYQDKVHGEIVLEKGESMIEHDREMDEEE